MRRTLAFVPALLALAGCQGLPGSGTSKTETRQLPSFSSIEVGGACTLDVTVGKPQSVEISGDDNILPLITTEVRGDRLMVRTEKPVNPQLPLRLAVSVPRLALVSVSGAARGEVRGIGGELFQFHVSGAANATLSGATKRLEIQASGAGSINAADLKAEAVEVQISGAGKADVHATRSLVARISGAAKVRYRGKPAQVTPEVSGVGSVTPMD